jgi:hypothetical protein
VTGQAARDDEDGVDADVVAGAHEARRQPLGGDDDAAQAIVVERDGGAFFGGASLEFDEGDDAAAAGDQVDFAAGDPRPPRENPPTMQPQPPGRQPLGAAAAFLGQLAAVQRLSSRARA